MGNMMMMMKITSKQLENMVQLTSFAASGAWLSVDYACPYTCHVSYSGCAVKATHASNPLCTMAQKAAD
jgi:hypothetical protein